MYIVSIHGCTFISSSTKGLLLKNMYMEENATMITKGLRLKRPVEPVEVAGPATSSLIHGSTCNAASAVGTDTTTPLR